MSISATRDWLATHWVTGAGFMAAVQLALLPLLAAALPAAFVLIFLHGPVYMIHQVEEHAGDRFRAFANARVFGGREALTTDAVLVINLPVVWGLNLGAFYAAFALAPGLGLVAPYAMLVNALTHIGARVKLGRYNPGLVSALALFLPLSIATLVVVGRLPGVGLGDHALGLGGAVLLHLMIMATVARRLRAAPPATA